MPLDVDPPVAHTPTSGVRSHPSVVSKVALRRDGDVPDEKLRGLSASQQGMAIAADYLPP